VSKDRVVGAGLMAVSIIVIAIYLWLLFIPPAGWVPMLVLEITAAIAVVGVLGILAWIGYTLATTPPPKPIEEIEKELEDELKKLEKETPEEKPSETKPASGEVGAASGSSTPKADAKGSESSK